MASPARSGAADAVKVAVRVRPLNARERNTRVVVEMDKASCWVLEEGKEKQKAEEPAAAGLRRVGQKAPNGNLQASNKFRFDYCLWSAEEETTAKRKYYDQSDVYQEIGSPLLDHVFKGFNVCLFAYGQTGSGKTHTMMGDISKGMNSDSIGIIPRMCKDLFDRIDAGTSEITSFEVQASYIELYNEQVCDLLSDGHNPDLKVRENPLTGPFVQGLEIRRVGSVHAVLDLIKEGNHRRHTAETKMNKESSRSHALFTLFFAEMCDAEEMEGTASASRVNLVDLAGSENINQSGVQGMNKTEAININLSLTTLRKVIDSLAKPHGGIAPPYRDSKLTYLLKDSLGNNAKTVMLATLSPSAVNVQQTKSTLHYASLARSIQNKAKANQDENLKLVQDLQNEVAALRSRLEGHAYYETRGLTPEKIEAMEAELKLKEEQEAELKTKIQQFAIERKLKEKQEEELKASKEEKDRLHAEVCRATC